MSEVRQTDGSIRFNNTIFKEPCPDLVEIVESGRLGDHDTVMRTLHGYFDSTTWSISTRWCWAARISCSTATTSASCCERAAVIDGNEVPCAIGRGVGVLKLAPEDATGVELANSDPSERIAELSRKLLNV